MNPLDIEHGTYPQLTQRRVKFLHNADILRRHRPAGWDIDFVDEHEAADRAIEAGKQEADYYRTVWGDKLTVASEPADTATAVDVAYGCSELGSRVIVSGGEIMELDSRPAISDEFDEGLPL